MADQSKIWEKIDKMPGGDKDPFNTPVGPTELCLSSNEVVAFAESEESQNGQNVIIRDHLRNCRKCRSRVDRYKAVKK